MNIDDLTGKRFGRLVVIKRGENKGEQTRWICQCDCGNITIVFASALKCGNTKSCGCLFKEKTSKTFTTHGLSKTRLYEIYYGMKKRCYKENCKAYKNYGARGIKVCDEWLGEDGFKRFYEWAQENGYDETLTIERINNNEGYCPDNCKWSSDKEQANNRRTNHMIKYNGEIHNTKEWAEIIGIPYQTLLARLNKCGWSVEKALTTPLLNKGQPTTESI